MDVANEVKARRAQEEDEDAKVYGKSYSKDEGEVKDVEDPSEGESKKEGGADEDEVDDENKDEALDVKDL